MAQTRAVLFDVYGTLVEITQPLQPYRRLLELAATRHGAFDPLRAGQLLMGLPGGMADAARRLGLSLSPTQLADLEQDLDQEIKSVRLFPETEEVLMHCSRHGIRVGLCSNLAFPYIAPAKAHLREWVDEAIWSCVVGKLKPDPGIFRIAVQRLRVEPQEILMVGDNYIADVAGVRSAGLNALHLDRRRRKGDIRSLIDVLDHIE